MLIDILAIIFIVTVLVTFTRSKYKSFKRGEISCSHCSGCSHANSCDSEKK